MIPSLLATLLFGNLTFADEGVTVRVDGALRYEDLPPPDPAVLEALQRYQAIRGASFVGFLAGDEGILIRTRFGDVDQLHHVASPGAARTQWTFDKEPVGSARPHPTLPDLVVFGRDSGGNEDTQNYLLNRRTGEERRITDGDHRHGGATWSYDGSRMAWSNNARNGRDEDIWIANADGGQARLLYQGEGSWSVAGWSRDGGTLLLGHYLSSTRSELWSLDVGSGAARKLSPEGEVSVSGGTFGPDGRWALAASDHEGDFKQLYRVDLTSGAWTSLTPGLSWGVDGYTMSDDGKTAMVLLNERGWDALYRLDLRKGGLTPVKGLPRAQIGTMGFDRDDPRTLALTLSGPDRASDVWTMDTKTQALTRWTSSETGGLDASRFVVPTTVTWTSFDGLQLDALEYRPPGPGPFPVVVSIHGGPEGQSRPTLSPLTQVLVQRGFVVLEPNVRGSTGYGKTFLALDNGKNRENSVKDIGTLLDWIATQPHLDKGRVGVRGGSYGGYMVLASLVHFGDRLRAGIDVVGISDFVTFLSRTRSYRQDLRRVEYGDERDPDMRAFLASISPLTHADRIRSRLLVMHGANDPRVPVSEAEQIVARVRQNGQRVSYLRAENEGHGFRKKANRDVSEALQVTFLEEALK